MAIPIIDIFAGPGGLGEGFSAFENEGERPFKIALSIEKDPWAHQTLTLRSFFRQFPTKESVPEEYYQFLRGEITLKTLYDEHPVEAILAKEEAWQATLGEIPSNEVDERIKKALMGEKDWILIGGPPCQAYSLVGRSRNQRIVLDEEVDHRVGLYKQYLRILAVHSPAVFIMENVKGLLSASTKDNHIFSKIRKDLSDPLTAYYDEFGKNGLEINCPGYKIYSLVEEPILDGNDNPINPARDFLVKTERYGVPQTRHRVILLGISNDIKEVPSILKTQEPVAVMDVINDLPKIRGGLSKIANTPENWKRNIEKILSNESLKGVDQETKALIVETVKNLKTPAKGIGQEFIPDPTLKVKYRADWFLDGKLKGVCNHVSKGHMESDFHRYLFVSAYGKVHGESPKLEHFPLDLLPKHKNVAEGVSIKKFADRFRVQIESKPCKTITSHISKDGHYYIHPDAGQCRSFTVREAARIQTFPDNYFFCGPRTEQFHQVGNAVPPLLSIEIAKIVSEFVSSSIIQTAIQIVPNEHFEISNS